MDRTELRLRWCVDVEVQPFTCDNLWHLESVPSYLNVSIEPLPTVQVACPPTPPHSAPSEAGGFWWWLWLLTRSSHEWWRFWELAGDRNFCVDSRVGRALNREPQSGVPSSSPSLSTGEGLKYELLLISHLITVLTSAMSYLLQECHGIWIISCK